MIRKHVVALGSLGLCTLTTAAAATTGLDSPDNGVVQVGRGSAWLARADDPLAAYYNPAALSRQATSVHLGAHLMFGSSCFTRISPSGDPVSPGNNIPGPGADQGPDPEVCTEGSVFPNPQIAANFRITDDLAIGLAVLGPHAVGLQSWPETVEWDRGDQPSPNRYLLLSADSTLVFPTLSVSYAVNNELSLGAGFIWGVAIVQFENFAETVSPSPPPGEAPSDDFDGHQDLRARLNAKDLFIPGVVLGGLWSPSDRLDLAGWFKWQDAVRASTGDLYLQAKYWKKGGAKNEDGEAADGPDNPANITEAEGAATKVGITIPMEAKLGLRYHHPRTGPIVRPDWAGPIGSPMRVRDPLSEDLFDVEMDITWANNSSVENVELRFKDGIAVNGTPGFVPPNGDIPHNWKDVLGVRLGGDFVVLPNFLAVRAGGYFETKGQEDEYLNLDFNLAQKFGLSGGATVRLGPVDVSAAYQHTFYGAIDNGGKGAIRALSGDATGTLDPRYRSRQIVNGGKLTSSIDEVALGGTLRF